MGKVPFRAEGLVPQMLGEGSQQLLKKNQKGNPLKVTPALWAALTQ